MPTESTPYDPLWSRVADVWRQSGIVVREGATEDAIADFELRNSVALPPDVRSFFLFADGTGDDMDDCLYRFWPLSEVRPVHEVLVSDRFVYPDLFAYPDCFVFADYSISIWDYAVRLTRNALQSGPVFRVTGGDSPGQCMANSFREFMEMYAENPDNIL